LSIGGRQIVVYSRGGQVVQPSLTILAERSGPRMDNRKSVWTYPKL